MAYLLAWILAVEVRQGTLGVDVVVEVRQGTLGGDTRGWGPAGNTTTSTPSVPCRTSTASIPAQCSLPDLNWAWMVVVEVRQRTLCVEGRGWAGGGEERRRTTRRRRGDEEERRGEEEQATDIKSNNPHLAGGKKHVQQVIICQWLVFPGYVKLPRVSQLYLGHQGQNPDRGKRLKVHNLLRWMRNLCINTSGVRKSQRFGKCLDSIPSGKHTKSYWKLP